MGGLIIKYHVFPAVPNDYARISSLPIIVCDTPFFNQYMQLCMVLHLSTYLSMSRQLEVGTMDHHGCDLLKIKLFLGLYQRE